VQECRVNRAMNYLNLRLPPSKPPVAWLLELIDRGENALVEFKGSLQKEGIETLTAFANTQGGAVLMGVSDAGAIVGVTVQAETVQGWINQCKQITSPRIIPDIELVQIQNKTVAILSIGEYPIKPVACKGRYFKRVGNANHQMSATEISDAHIKLINSSWDYHPDPEHTRASISEPKVQAFAAAIKVEASINNVLKSLNSSNKAAPPLRVTYYFRKTMYF